MNLKKLLFSFIFLITFNLAQAQMLGGHAYMIGERVILAINANGHEVAPCPGDTLNCRSTGGNLGVVADPGTDWAEFNGDYYACGSTECGFGIKYDTDGSSVEVNNNFMGGLAEITGEITDFEMSADSVIVTWEGTVSDMGVTVRYLLKKDQIYYTTEITLENTSAAAFTDVYYMHNFDPDNNYSLNGQFNSVNIIESQSEMANDSVIVSATQDAPWESTVVLHAEGENWKGYYGGFINRDPVEAWYGTGFITTVEGSNTLSDAAIGVAYYTEEIAAGESEAFSFVTAFDSNVEFEVDQTGINENKLAVNVYPNPVINNIINIELSGNYTYTITDLKGSIMQQEEGTHHTVIDLSNFENGVYILEVKQNNQIFNQKIVLQ